MATYRQILESLGISEGGKVASRQDAKPGDIWQTDSGNWYGMRVDKETKKPESQGYGREKNSKDKAILYAKGGDPSTLDANPLFSVFPKSNGRGNQHIFLAAGSQCHSFFHR